MKYFKLFILACFLVYFTSCDFARQNDFTPNPIDNSGYKTPYNISMVLSPYNTITNFNDNKLSIFASLNQTKTYSLDEAIGLGQDLHFGFFFNNPGYSIQSGLQISNLFIGSPLVFTSGSTSAKFTLAASIPDEYLYGFNNYDEYKILEKEYRIGSAVNDEISIGGPIIESSPTYLFVETTNSVQDQNKLYAVLKFVKTSISSDFNYVYLSGRVIKK